MMSRRLCALGATALMCGACALVAVACMCAENGQQQERAGVGGVHKQLTLFGVWFWGI